MRQTEFSGLPLFASTRFSHFLAPERWSRYKQIACFITWKNVRLCEYGKSLSIISFWLLDVGFKSCLCVSSMLLLILLQHFYFHRCCNNVHNKLKFIKIYNIYLINVLIICLIIVLKRKHRNCIRKKTCKIFLH